MSDSYNSIPGVSYDLTIEDKRKGVQTQNVLMLLPIGADATAIEGEVCRYTDLSPELEKIVGDNAQLKKFISGFAESSNKAPVIGLPFNPGTLTPAIAKVPFVYEKVVDPKLGEGTIVFSLNGERYEVAVTKDDTIETLVTNMLTMINSDLDFTAEVNPLFATTVNVITKELGSLANSSAFKFLVTDKAFVLPSNLKLPSNISFTGGSQSRKLDEIIVLYKSIIKQGVKWLLYPYSDLDMVNQIQLGLKTIYTEQKIENIDFPPVPQIIVRTVMDLDDAKEYRSKLNELNTCFVPILNDWDDVLAKFGSIAGCINAERTKRINNSTAIKTPKIVNIQAFSQEEVSELLHYGISPLVNEDTGVEIVRLVSSYKETNESQPFNFLSFVIGCAFVVTSLVAFERMIKARKYLITRSPDIGGDFITAALLQQKLYIYLDTNLVNPTDDRVVEDFEANDIGAISTGVDSVNFTFEFAIPGELNKIHASAIAVIGE